MLRRSSAELHEQASELRGQAATARTHSVMAGLYELAERFDALADERAAEEAILLG